MYRSKAVLFLTLYALVAINGCDDGTPTGQQSGNQQPSRPQLVTPATGTALPGELMWLEWSCNDPEGDSLRYELFTGDSRYPEYTADLGSATRAFVRAPLHDTVFIWGVVVTDRMGRAVPSDVWRIPIGNAFRYPMGDGNRWTYSGRHWYSNVIHGGWSPPDPVPGATIVTDSSVESDSGPYSILTEAAGYGGTLPGEGRSGGSSYLINRVDGLFQFAHEGQTMTTPGKSNSGMLRFSRFSFNDVYDLGATLLGRSVLNRSRRPVEGPRFHDEMLEVLHYPPEIGVQWAFSRPRDNDGGLVIDKVYTGIADVTVPAGTFTCYEVRWLHDLDHDGLWDKNVEVRDYISEQGLIKRTIVARAVRVSTYDRIYAAVADLTTVWELESLTISE